MIVRRDEMRASKAMQHRVLNTPNIEVLFNHMPKEVIGGKTVEGVIVTNVKTNEERTLNVTGFFVAIGHHPNSDIFKPWLDMDETGYLITKKSTSETNIEGVFACGDVQDSYYKTNREGVFAAGDVADKIYRQAVTAAGTGCMAALDAERYLAAKGIH